MSDVATEDALHRIRRALLVGTLLLLPRIALAWLVLPAVFDLVQILATLLAVVGVFLIGTALVRLRVVRRRALLPVGLGGAAALMSAVLLLWRFPVRHDAVAFGDGLAAPSSVALAQWGSLAIGGLAEFGLVLLVGSIVAAVNRGLSR